MENVLPRADIAALKPEHQLLALEDRDGDSKRLHLIVQPELPYQHIIGYHIQLDRISQGFPTSVAGQFIKLIHIFQDILNGESTTLILP